MGRGRAPLVYSWYKNNNMTALIVLVVMVVVVLIVGAIVFDMIDISK